MRMYPELKPLLSFSQDESIVNQFTLHPKQWVSPEGQRAILLKTDGMEIMISAFTSRMFNCRFRDIT